MRSLSSIPRPLLLAMASLFGLSLVIYTAVWIYYAGWSAPAYIGIEWKPELKPYVTIKRVVPGGPAERAGLRAEDRVLTLDGYPQHVMSVAPALARGKPGDVVTIVLERPGVRNAITLKATLEAPPPRKIPTVAQSIAIKLIDCYPAPFLVVGLLVLFLRVEDRNAWLLALMFAGFIAAAPVAFLEGVLSPPLRRFMLSYNIAMDGPLAAVFYIFFATFPSPSPIDRKLPWLKHLFLVVGLAVSLPFAAIALVTGSSLTAIRVLNWAGERTVFALSTGYEYSGLGLGLVSLVWNSIKAPTANDRRKTQVMVWGTVVGLAPFLINAGIALAQHKVIYEYPFWFWGLPVIALLVIPLSFAYAVVKHRVLEIPVLIKRSARYFLVQRGFVLLILVLGIAVTLMFAHALRQYFPHHERVGVPMGTGLGVILVWGGTLIQSRVTRRLDRAFFRSAYDTRQILMDLAGKTRTAASRDDLAQLLQHEINEALHPLTIVIYARDASGHLVTSANVPAELRSLPPDLPILRAVQERAHAWDVVALTGGPVLSILQPLQPECLVPSLGRDGELLGLAVLGPRLSEEPYSGEDKRLLDLVANQAGTALENIGMAEKMAERLEAERRAAQEMDIARQVQNKLLPQKSPVLQTLDYAGACIQARAVGGDYYDFLDLGEGRLGLVLADVAGKGISAALLMANLQAHLRSQSALVAKDLPKTLQSVNRLFYEATEPNKYATLFLGVYDDATRRLLYANCGHNPPVLLRAEQAETLTGTATVLGLFEDWQCSIAETCLHPGDTLAICTDGVFEAANPEGEEFGEAGLIAALQAYRQLAAKALLEAVIAAVKQYAPGEQADDLTLIIARATNP
ncbi:MAG TPA: SpoIIE family protein phosphatase [Terracidiphilus sp.]|nr:SpoIIE family protein phosphatase [Terracidiphilus sp.]